MPGYPPPPSPPRVTFRWVAVSLRGPGQSPVLPSACCVGSPRSVGRCGLCSCRCCFRVRGAQWLVSRGHAGCCRGRVAVFPAPSRPMLRSSTTRLAAFPWARGPSGCCFFTGPWTVTRSSLRMLHVASGCCFQTAAAAGALAGVVSAFTEPSSWCVGAVLNVAWCAFCASAAPNSWRIEDVLVVAGVV